MATIQLSPSEIPVNASGVTVKAFGLNGSGWTSATTAALTGGTGASIASQSIDVPSQVITMSVNAGSVAGPLTITVGSATVTLHAGKTAKNRWFPGLARHHR